MRIQSTTPLTVYRSNDGPSTASVSPYLASSSRPQITPFLIQSVNQHHGLSIQLRSIGAYRHTISSFSRTPGIGAVADHIDDLTTWSVRSADGLSILLQPHTWSEFPELLPIMLKPSVDGHNLRSVDKTTGRRWLRGSFLHCFLHFYFGQLSYKTQIKTHLNYYKKSLDIH